MQQLYDPALKAAELENVLRTPIKDNVFVPAIQFLIQLTMVIAPLFGLLLMAALLMQWRKRENCGIRLWYHKTNPIILGFILLCSFLITPFSSDPNFSLYQFLGNTIYLNLFFSMILPILLQIVYLKWFDKKPRYLIMPLGVLAISSYMVLISALSCLVYPHWFDFHTYGEFDLIPTVRVFATSSFFAFVIVMYPAVRNKILTFFKPAGAYND